MGSSQPGGYLEPGGRDRLANLGYWQIKLGGSYLY